MIDANELRIGNWVGYQKHFCQVDAICYYPNDDHKEVSIKNNHFGGILSFENINPIPLSENILISCGFKYFKDYDDVEKKEVNTYYIKIGKIQISFIYRMLVINANNEHSREAQIILNYEVEYLHQLQNLYYILCGKELEINL